MKKKNEKKRKKQPFLEKTNKKNKKIIKLNLKWQPHASLKSSANEAIQRLFSLQIP